MLMPSSAYFLDISLNLSEAESERVPSMASVATNLHDSFSSWYSFFSFITFDEALRSPPSMNETASSSSFTGVESKTFSSVVASASMDLH